MSTAHTPERIHKFLAQAGIASRRQVESWIKAGRITVNGKVAQPGDRITAADKVRLDGELLHAAAPSAKTRILAYHKPAGEVCTRSDEKGRPTVFAALPSIRNGRWINIGRLDINTTGLLLFTNDGKLANRLMHPSGEMEREYAVRVFGEVKKETLNKLLKGVQLEDGRAAFDSIHDAGGQGRNHWYHVVIREGRNREIKRMWESQGVTVSRLMRVRFGPYQLPRTLRPGEYHEFSRIEVNEFLNSVKREA
ncbi:MAG: 23S rRNA pseudouridine(2605) synthase RluB [Gammaproteobacteria bacterium]